MEKKTMKEWRNARGVTQETLAHETNICYSSILAYDNGYRIPPVDKAIKIAEVLKVAVEDVKWGEQ